MLKTRVYATLFGPVAKPIGSRKPVVVYRFSGIGNVSNMLPSLIAGPGKFGSNFFARAGAEIRETYEMLIAEALKGRPRVAHLDSERK